MGGRKIGRIARFILLMTVLLMGACSGRGDGVRSAKSQSGREYFQEWKEITREEDPLVPLQSEKGVFRSALGWLDARRVAVCEEQDGKTVVSSYGLKSGRKEEIFTLDSPITSAQLSPSGRMILVHTVPSPYESDLIIYDAKTGKKRYETRLEAWDLAIEWNPFNEEELLVTTFFEDWSYEVYRIHMGRENIQKIGLEQPFAIWRNEDSFAYLDWGPEGMDMTAPLIVAGDGQEKRLFPDRTFYYLDGWKEAFLAIGPDRKDINRAEFILFDQQAALETAFSVPHLSTFSGWQIPNYDYSPETGDFFLIEPKESGEADVYHGGFRLVKRNISGNGSEVILENAENEPIRCSPDGAYCLSGYFLEKVIDVQGKTIEDLVQTN
jgi:hypothetical protein